MKYALPAVLLLAACSPKPAEKPPETPAVGLANPASVYCVEKGGKSEIRTEANGQRGYCHLPDGRVVDEWDLFRAEKSPPSDLPASAPRG
ncbi:putative hemolysin [Sandaracinobacteroides hominis]|uniref:putative hemolysin n=1 Tax=Sandaracinobacteroides hominis TaxID=2780086 RepID=UPI0018F4B11D|nr:DUF333 domain-containing protein [Sandaracinobacteroides hominis]